MKRWNLICTIRDWSWHPTNRFARAVSWLAECKKYQIALLGQPCSARGASVWLTSSQPSIRNKTHSMVLKRSAKVTKIGKIYCPAIVYRSRSMFWARTALVVRNRFPCWTPRSILLVWASSTLDSRQQQCLNCQALVAIALQLSVTRWFKSQTTT